MLYLPLHHLPAQYRATGRNTVLIKAGHPSAGRTDILCFIR